MKKTKLNMDKKLFLNKEHVITLTADQSNGVAGGGTIGMTAKISFPNDNTHVSRTEQWHIPA